MTNRTDLDGLPKESAAQMTRLVRLDAAIARGLADCDAGRLKSAVQVFDRLEAKYRALADLK